VVDWLIFIEDQGWSAESAAELNKRVKARDDAHRRLLLLSSDEFFAWLTTAYAEAEYELKRTYASAVRDGRKPDGRGLAARRNFTRLLREDVVNRMRPEVVALRKPMRAIRLGTVCDVARRVLQAVEASDQVEASHQLLLSSEALSS